MKSHLRLILPLLTIGIAVAGCSSKNTLQIPDVLNPLAKDKKPEPSIPIREIVCVWKHAEGLNKHGSPSRGVAGQIMFFTLGSDTPVKIDDDSDVVIYMFDDQGAPEDQSKPLSTIRFVNNSWNKHHGIGRLGPTYQVFVPYERKAVHQVKVTLSVRVIPKDRRPVSSMMDTVTLYGPIRNSAKFARRIEPSVNPHKTNVSSFGAGSKEDKYAALSNKILANQGGSKPRNRRNTRADQIADSLLRNAGISPGRFPSATGIRHASGRQEPAGGEPRSTGGPTRNAENFDRGTREQGFPQSGGHESKPLPGIGFQLRPAPNAPKSFERQATHRERREPASVPSRHPLGNVREPASVPSRHPLGNVRQPAVAPAETQPQPRHPLDDNRGPFRVSRKEFTEAPPLRHPLNRQPSPSRRFFPKDNAWNSTEKAAAPTAGPHSFDDRRADIQRNFGPAGNQYQHPLGKQADRPTGSRQQPPRHPLAGGFDSRRSFR